MLSIILAFTDYHSTYLRQLRSWLSTIITPVHWLAEAPVRIQNFISKNLTSRIVLLEKNESLRAENLFLQQQLQQIASLSEQNKHLRELLNSSKNMQSNVKIAEVIGVAPDPQIKQILLNKGIHDHVYVGQPVLDAYGIIGQVVSTSYYSSRVLLITDNSSRIPIEINKTGYRAIAAGNYADNTLSLLDIPNTATIAVNDLLVSSGLGNRFPAGYPVGKVTAIEKIPGSGFKHIQVEPMAKINRSRLVLLLYSKKEEPSKNQAIKDYNSTTHS